MGTGVVSELVITSTSLTVLPLVFVKPSSMSASEQSDCDENLHENDLVESQLANYGLSPDNITILRQYRDRWKEAKGRSRTKIAKEAYEEIVCEEGIDNDKSKAGKQCRKLKREVGRAVPINISVIDSQAQRESSGGFIPSEEGENQLTSFIT